MGVLWSLGAGWKLVKVEMTNGQSERWGLWKPYPIKISSWNYGCLIWKRKDTKRPEAVITRGHKYSVAFSKNLEDCVFQLLSSCEIHSSGQWISRESGCVTSRLVFHAWPEICQCHLLPHDDQNIFSGWCGSRWCSSISLGLWMTVRSKLPPTLVTTDQHWGLGQVTPKWVSIAYWLFWFSYLGNSQWKRDTFLSVSLKAGNKPAIWKGPFMYLEIERHHCQQMQGIQGWEVNLVTSFTNLLPKLKLPVKFLNN